jgi:hypothetical protein
MTSAGWSENLAAILPGTPWTIDRTTPCFFQENT